MRLHTRTRRLAVLLPLLLLALAGGCARNAPSENGGANALSGKRLKVLLKFRAPLNPNYYYFFVLNNSNNQNAPGPIPVGPPISGQPYDSNGFATSSNVGQPGFTDFVLYSANNGQYGAQAVANVGLYHVADNTDPNVRANFKQNGTPILYYPPNSGQTDANTLYFEIDLSQLYPNASSQADAVNTALSARWMQVNVVATNNTPTDIQTSVSKMYDSFGDDSDGRGNFLTVDLTQTSPYLNGNPTLAALQTEPSFNDVYVYPPGSLQQDPALDLVDWSITVSTQ